MKKTFICELKPTYYVDQKSRTTVCKTTALLCLGEALPKIPTSVICDILNTFDFKISGIKISKVTFTTLKIESTCKTVCHANDTYNEEKGKYIAQTKCQRQFYSWYYLFISKLAAYYANNLLYPLNAIIDNIGNAREQAINHLDYLTGNISIY